MKPSLTWHTQLSDLPFTGGHLDPVGWASHCVGYCKHSSPATSSRPGTRFCTCCIASILQFRERQRERERLSLIPIYWTNITWLRHCVIASSSSVQCVTKLVIISYCSSSVHSPTPQKGLSWSVLVAIQLLTLLYTVMKFIVSKLTIKLTEISGDNGQFKLSGSLVHSSASPWWS